MVGLGIVVVVSVIGSTCRRFLGGLYLKEVGEGGSASTHCLIHQVD